MRNIKIGVIGLGYMGQHHIKALSKMISDNLINASITSVCDRDLSLAQMVSVKYSIPYYHSDINDFMSSDEINVVWIATPSNSHFDIVIAAINANKDIYCEKPLAGSYGEVKHIVSILHNKKIKNQSGLLLRFSPSLNKIRSILQSGSLGRPVQITLREYSPLPIKGIYKSELDERLNGRGILWEENIHDIDILFYLLGGKIEYQAGILSFNENENYEYDAQVILRHEYCPISFSSSWHKIKGQVPKRRLEILFKEHLLVTEYFTSGDIAIHGKNNNVEILKEVQIRNDYVISIDGNNLLEDFNRYPYYATFADYHFVRMISLGSEPSPSFEESVDAHRLIEKIYSQAERNIVRSL